MLICGESCREICFTQVFVLFCTTTINGIRRADLFTMNVIKSSFGFENIIWAPLIRVDDNDNKFFFFINWISLGENVSLKGLVIF